MKHVLSQLGLDDTESGVYTSLLRLGESSVSEITKDAGITRTLGYHVLEKLGWYGLVNETKGRGKKRMYVAEHPRQILQFVKNKEKTWQNRVKKAEEILPDLLSLYRIDNKPVIRYQEGVKGVIALFEESLESTTTILSILDVESWKSSEFWDWAREYNRERNKRKIKEQILILDTVVGREWIKNYKGSRVYTEYRWVDPTDIKDIIQFGGEINVYEEKVMIAMLQQAKNVGIIIESTVLANILRSMFLIIWKQAEKIVF